jgi:uncharacterized protein YpmS
MEAKKIISVIAAILFMLFLLFNVNPTKDSAGIWLLIIFSSLVWGGIVYAIVSSIYSSASKSKIAKDIQQKIADSNEQKELRRVVNNDIREYQKAKNSYKYLSNSSLISIYKDFLNKGIENMERLALEEVMVDKGILENSPMHEKLYLIKKSILDEE